MSIQLPAHNKKRNCGLCYEFLTRHIGSLMLENKKYDGTVRLIEKFFKNSPLKSELELFEVLTSCKGKNKEYVKAVIDEVSKRSFKLDFKKIDAEKSKLIREINTRISKNIFSYKVGDYKLYATIQQFINAHQSDKKINESINRIAIGDLLLKNLVEYKEAEKKIFSKYDDFMFINLLDSLTSGIRNLKGSQKNLMLEYVDSISNSDSVKKFFDKHTKNILNVMKENVGKFTDDTNQKILFAIKKLDETKDKMDEQEKICKLLEYTELVDELGNKND